MTATKDTVKSLWWFQGGAAPARVASAPHMTRVKRPGERSGTTVPGGSDVPVTRKNGLLCGPQPGSGGGPNKIALPPWTTAARFLRPVGLGYHPDLPDRRDKVLGEGGGTRMLPDLQRLASSEKGTRSFILHGKKAGKMPSYVDLRHTGLFSAVEHQGDIGSCTAQAVIGLAEFLMNRGKCLPFDLSRLFLYKASRRLLGWTGDTGAYIRTTIKAMVTFGVPPEDFWPYEPGRFDDEPEAFHYAYAANFKAVKYARLDGYGADETGEIVLNRLKACIADGFPVAFGFPVYESIESLSAAEKWVVPVPTGDRQERLLGGHAVLAVGYNDDLQAVLFRNSWGADWADDGYAWLPYAYVVDELATDFWTLFEMNWIGAGLE